MKNRQSAFTLLEIMLVVAIIGVLLAAAIYKMSPALGVAKETRTRADIQGIRTMLLSYNGSNGTYPESLSALVPRLMDEVTKYAWVLPTFTITEPKPGRLRSFSAGPDRIRYRRRHYK
jgi:prepilin-type N-terminal cleavage/methylation domain-containing protein